MKKVAVLGCGPSGLVAAHAVHMAGHDVEIFSKRRKSFLFGSQYLHEPIPGFNSMVESAVVTYENVGTPEEYRRKCHGQAWDGMVAPEEFETKHPAWNIRDTYDRLWRHYGPRVQDYEIRNLYKLDQDITLDKYDMVISTVPRTIWENPFSNEQFVHSKCWAVGDAPEYGKFAPFSTEKDNTIICNGSEETSWYRLSRVFGYTTIEWPEHKKPPVQNAVMVQRPLRYIPDPNQVNPADQMMHVGRYGEWKKGVVVSDVYNQVFNALKEEKAAIV